MRLAVVIVALTAIAVGMVHIRRDRTRLRHETQEQQNKQLTLRRTLWDQQVRLGWLTAPAELRRRVDELALQLVDKTVAADSNARPAPAARAPVSNPPR